MVLFPACFRRDSKLRLRSFRLVIEPNSGDVVFVALKGKTAPTGDTATRIVKLLGDDPYVDQVRANAALDELGLHAVLVNNPVDSEKVRLPATVLAEVLRRL